MAESATANTKLPTGRPPGSRSLRVLAARRAQECLSVLADVATSENAPEADRVRAAELVLQYATKRAGVESP